MNKTVSQELKGLIKLISFFKQVRHQTSIEKLGFFFTNDLFNIIPYRQCILWSYQGSKIKLITASGQVSIEKNSPYAQAIKTIIKHKLKTDPIGADAEARSQHIQDHCYAHISEISNEDKAILSDQDVQSYLAPHTSHVTLLNQHEVIGGLWIARDTALRKIEHAVLEDASDALADKLAALTQKNSRLKGFRGKHKAIKIALLTALIAFCLWPVRMSVTSTAEIIAENKRVITVPFNSLIEDVHVSPNQIISKGDLLLSLDQTNLKNELALKKQELETIKQTIAKTERHVFSDPDKITELNTLREDLKLRQLEVNYAKDRLDFSNVTADQDGIVLFSDKNDLIGKPVQAGEAIMDIANPRDMELLVKIPAGQMITLDQTIPARFFLNTSPLTSHEAMLTNISYQPSLDAGGLITYKARATLQTPEAIEKIGLTGTAKLYGGRTIMIVNVLRRPFIALRNMTSF